MAIGFQLFVDALNAGQEGWRTGKKEAEIERDAQANRNWLEAQRQRELVRQGREDVAFEQEQETYRAEKPVRELARELSILQGQEAKRDLTDPDRARLRDLKRKVELGDLEANQEAQAYAASPAGKTLLANTRKLNDLTAQVAIANANDALDPKTLATKKVLREAMGVEAKNTLATFQEFGEEIAQNKFGVGPKAQMDAVDNFLKIQIGALDKAMDAYDKTTEEGQAARQDISATIAELISNAEKTKQRISQTRRAPAVADPAEVGMNPLDVLRRRKLVETARNAPDKTVVGGANIPTFNPSVDDEIADWEARAKDAYARGNLAGYRVGMRKVEELKERKNTR